MKRIYNAPIGKYRAGDVISVFGWYEKQEWVTVRLIGDPKVEDGLEHWFVERVTKVD